MSVQYDITETHKHKIKKVSIQRYNNLFLLKEFKRFITNSSCELLLKVDWLVICDNLVLK